MCGIFGISKNLDKSKDYDKILEDINLYVSYSQNRGSDTFGISFKLKDKILLFKSNEKPSKAITRKEYKNFLNDNLKDQLQNQLLMIGQTRLVTNGSKFSYKNNQPLQCKNVIGVHNGIFTNLQETDTEKTINYESYDVKSDSLMYFEKLSEISDQEDFITNYLKFIKSIVGNYSIAFFLKNENKIFISSNCGSLYYYYNEDFFSFASEKKFLKQFLKKSSLNNKADIKDDELIKCLNSTIIFNKDDNNLIKIDHESENLKNLNISIKNDLNFSIFNNQEYQSRKLENLKKCSKCILPETYPFIKFNKNNICNYCENYEKQVFQGENQLNGYLEKFRSKNGEPDCIVGLSGGRDSSYGLHLLKIKYKLNPVAYTFDWGLTTDISRINAAKVCGKL